MLSHSGGLEHRAVHTATTSLVSTNCWKYSFSLNVRSSQVPDSRWSCKERKNSKCKLNYFTTERCEIVIRACWKHMTIFAEEQVWLLYFELLFILFVCFISVDWTRVLLDIDMYPNALCIYYVCIACSNPNCKPHSKQYVCTLWHLCTGTCIVLFWYAVDILDFVVNHLPSAVCLVKQYVLTRFCISLIKFGNLQYIDNVFCLVWCFFFCVCFTIPVWLGLHQSLKRLSTAGISGKDLPAHFREDFTQTA